ncbi:MAG TPA: class I tRNA ligase family protein, partial [Phycisphaerae bacterium]|nr:class I tRNA ligase family protein [Phycisphaerae bacterium]
DQTLRLMSPFLPFITERLWEELNRIAPQRGLPGVADCPPSDILMLAPFPPREGYAALDDPHVLEVFEDIQSAVRGVRDLRNKCVVPVKQKVDVTIKAAREHLDLLAEQQHIIAEMAGVASMNLVTEARRPANAGTTVVGPLQIFVHDISDDAAERKRLEKELADVEKRLAACTAKLGNAKFTANAKPEIVEAERARQADLEKSKAAVQESLAELS